MADAAKADAPAAEAPATAEAPAADDGAPADTAADAAAAAETKDVAVDVSGGDADTAGAASGDAGDADAGAAAPAIKAPATPAVEAGFEDDHPYTPVEGHDTVIPIADSIPKERRQSFAGHGLYYAYKRRWGPIIHAVMGFNKAPSRDAIIEVIRSKLLQYPRFACRVSEDTNDWVRVDNVCIGDHLDELHLAGDEPPKKLLEKYISSVLHIPFDETKPQWHGTLISYDNTERCDLLWRINHSIGDGITLATLLIDLCERDDSREPLPAGPRRERPAPGFFETGVGAALYHFFFIALIILVPIFCVGLGPESNDWFNREPIAESLRVFLAIVYIMIWCMLWEPTRIFCRAYMKVNSLAIAAGDTHTMIKGGKGQLDKMDPCDKRFASTEDTPISVARCKEVAARVSHTATINDVLQAALGGGLRRYLEKKGDPAVANNAKVKLRAISIVNMRALKGLQQDAKTMLEDVKNARWGNDFSYFIIRLPCDPVRNGQILNRIADMDNEMSFVKKSPEGMLIRQSNQSVYDNCSVDFLMKLNQHNLNKLECFMSNMPGPQVPLKFAGEPLIRLSNCTHPLEFGTGYSFLSYNGFITLCAVSDGKIVPNPSEITDCVMEEYRAFEEAVGLEPEVVATEDDSAGRGGDAADSGAGESKADETTAV